MKYLYILILLLLSTPCFAELTATEQLQENTVVLTDTRGHGSGVLFTRTDAERVTTFIWTAAHVANMSMNDNGTFREIEVIQGDKRAVARVLRSSDNMFAADCALLEVVSGDDFNGTARFYRGFNHIKVGQKVVHCGTPYARLNERLVSFGQVSFVDRLFDDFRMVREPRRMDNVDITAYPGCSGGPVVDEDTYDIIGLLVMGSAPRLTIIEPTRAIFDWAKVHDCMWAFDRDVALPPEIAPWRGDLYDRIIEDRYTGDLDDRWGELPPEPEVKIIEVNLEELLELVQDLLGVVLKQIPVIAPPMPPLDPPFCERPPIGLDPESENTSPGFPDPSDPSDVPGYRDPPNRVPPEPNPPTFEVPPLEITPGVDVGDIIIEEDGTIIVRDADGNLIEVIDPSDSGIIEIEIEIPGIRDPFNMPVGVGYQHLLST